MRVQWSARLIPLVVAMIIGLTLLAALVVAAPAGAREAKGEPGAPAAKNVILVIGDGMAETQILATRYLYEGRDGRLAMESVPLRGQAATYSFNDLVTDSAAAGTAIGSGHLVNNGALNVTPDGTSRLEDTLGVLAKRSGKSVGLIATRDIANATPAAFASAVPSRREQNAIAAQYLDNKVDVLLGGGEAFFLPKGERGQHCTPGQTRREDDRNLLTEYGEAGYTVVRTSTELAAADLSGDRLLGLFGCTDLAFDLDRPADEPSIAAQTDAALKVLDRNEKGFFLMVEGGMIDPAAERNDARNTMGDTRALDEAVRRVLDYAAGRDDTLVVVTADHEAGGMSLVFGARAQQQFETADGRTMSIAFATSPGHTGVPVPVRAMGPGSEGFDKWTGDEHLMDMYTVLRDAMLTPVRAAPAAAGASGSTN